MNPKLLLLSLLCCAATVSVRAQDVAQPKPGTVVVEHGDDRITIEFGDSGKPKVTHNGSNVAADGRAGALDAYRYLLKDYQLKVTTPTKQTTPFEWGQTGGAPTYRDFQRFFRQQQATARPHIGVQVGSVTAALAYQLELDPQRCVLVLSVTADGPAAKAGLRANDILLRVGEEERVDNTTLSSAVAACKAGDELEVEALQRGERKVLTIAVGEEKVDPLLTWLGGAQNRATALDPQKNPLFAGGGWNTDAFDRARNTFLSAQAGKGQDYESLRDEVKQLRAEWERLRKQLERDAAKADKRDR
ncbi:MAG: PDZ domain-containing protein [Planctomycetes bacterium]|nr:PDZ domain-containing protein [Planctomycetota bacterium]